MRKIFEFAKKKTLLKKYQGYTIMKMSEHWILVTKQELLLKKYRMMTHMFKKGKGAVDGENWCGDL